MALADLTSRDAVLRAIQDCDDRTRQDFLTHYGFGASLRYFLVHEGQLYDSKAIVGVAHGYEFPERGPLAADEFSGGESTVRRKLEELGFEVRVLDTPSSPPSGD